NRIRRSQRRRPPEGCSATPAGIARAQRHAGAGRSPPRYEPRRRRRRPHGERCAHRPGRPGKPSPRPRRRRPLPPSPTQRRTRPPPPGRASGPTAPRLPPRYGFLVGTVGAPAGFVAGGAAGLAPDFAAPSAGLAEGTATVVLKTFNTSSVTSTASSA